MGAPELPYDITFCITEYFDTSIDDRRSLMALSLTSKSFLPICQERLFSSVTLSDEKASSDSDSDHDKISYLAKILEGSPHVGNYIRSLTYERGTKSTEHASFELVAHIISALPRLRELRLSFPTAFDWGSNLHCSGAAKFTRVVQEAIANPALSTIHLQLVTNFPVSLFTDKCQELVVAEDGPSSLSLSAVKIFDVPPPSDERIAIRIRRYAVGKKSWPRKVQYKTIDGINFLGSEYPYFPPLDLRDLDQLSITLNTEDDLEQAKKIQSLSQSIRHLQVEATRYMKFAGTTAFVAGSRSTLQVLTLCFTVHCDSDPWSSISNEVAAMAGQGLLSLRRLIISTSHCSCGTIPSSALESIDKVLSGDRFPALRSVQLDIRVGRKHGDLNILEIYRPHLPLLYESKKVDLIILPEVQS